MPAPEQSLATTPLRSEAAPSGLRAARVSRGVLSRTLPFALFMGFIAVDEAARMAAAAGYISLSPGTLYYLYPVKVICVALLLYRYRRDYVEFDLLEVLRDRRWVWTSAVGLATFVLWICMDWTTAVTGAPPGFDPGLLPSGPVRVALMLFRVAGAALVVPVMEELFWRSFLQRYLVDPDFLSVPLGKFTLNSFLITALLFGLEHHFFVAGITAGIIYSLILYKTRSIAHCVLAHAVTNLALAVYVIYTGKWYFW